MLTRQHDTPPHGQKDLASMSDVLAFRPASNSIATDISQIDAYELATALWLVMHEEARRETDPVLFQLIQRSILHQPDLGTALGHLLAFKFGNELVSADALTHLMQDFLAARPDAIERTAADLCSIRARDPAATNHLTPFLFFKGFQTVQAHRLANWLWHDGRSTLARHIQGRASELFAVDIHPGATIGQRVMFDHGTGIIVGETAVIEDDVALLQNVTLGGTGKESGKRHPKVRRGALIGTGAKVLGNIEIGEGARVGAGAIVLKDVAPFSTVVGNPARAVGTRHATLPALTMDQSIPAPDYVI
ncbi:serine O-acetyltransferase [Acetobacter estunensis]|uniref:serine O-acetyltransferase n=1 Tax=Acetobacter estunensis TaxID=104097 RepID=UPI0020C5709B|nr:serine O-acetyltransferase [Acetobacter estunensis]